MLVVEQFIQDLGILNFIFDQTHFKKIVFSLKMIKLVFFNKIYRITYSNYLELILQNIYF